jgi:Mrp family chromosome partitioning ATPase
MVIDRALEKMKRGASAGAATATAGAAPSAAIPIGRSVSVENAHRRISAAAEPQTHQRMKLPRLEIDSAVANSHRIYLPQSTDVEAAQASAAYRILRTRLLQKLRRNQWTTLAITSPGAGEGKSLTTINLALNLSRDAATSVFVLDLDMRNPSICRYLGVSPPQELVSYFRNEGSPADVLFSIGVDNLGIAGSIVPTDHASELLAGSRFEELLTYITSIAQDPIILIDLPPVLVTDEALLLAPRVDACALVVAEGRTRRDSLMRAKGLLGEFNFAGVILNRSSASFGADSYYGYGQNYGAKY